MRTRGLGQGAGTAAGERELAVSYGFLAAPQGAAEAAGRPPHNAARMAADGSGPGMPQAREAHALQSSLIALSA